MINEMIIVDGHVHSFTDRNAAQKVIQAFNNVYEIQFDNPGTGDIDDILTNMDNAKVDYTVLANFTTLKYIETQNLWTLDTCEKNRSLIPLISFHPDMEDSISKLFNEYIKRGAKGVKLHPMAQGFSPNDSRMNNLYSLCQEAHIPVVFHCGRVANARLNEFSDLNEILPVIKEFKKLPVVLTHMADGNLEDCLMVSSQYENVFFDTSIVVTGYSQIRNTNEPSWLDDEMVISAFEKIGIEKIVFGSDYPWGSTYYDLQRFLKLDLPKDKLSRILGGNALKLFNII